MLHRLFFVYIGIGWQPGNIAYRVNLCGAFVKTLNSQTYIFGGQQN